MTTYLEHQPPTRSPAAERGSSYPESKGKRGSQHAGERELSTISGSRPFDSNRGELVLLCVVASARMLSIFFYYDPISSYGPLSPKMHKGSRYYVFLA